MDARLAGVAEEVKPACQRATDWRKASRSTCASPSYTCLSDLQDDDEEDASSVWCAETEYASSTDTPRQPPQMGQETSGMGALRRIRRSYNFRELCDLGDASDATA
mmetsp:Transcript_17899/g.56405  ORF Transcript_17899/g.56405 Transcript_17899/m.56405 type:complete len:106 (-) Transcript_17899:233-550(-)|eukprot:CAMPEP_0204562216 /NCGR_PEP_ID=MMETSP0661-20131031/33628_1 /ASSEMBLY_ACC=CAM_ASM_000606 /TAXON_ID=109239 /ORGANISM="Alexandrium margalefi, Strain AMGDE01CS-322" /LENGTH=105 /DNA_ID=CAMNT_0051569687 /DNA_START=65 /DNA_END=382 /DNA_ORIENTATION=+